MMQTSTFLVLDDLIFSMTVAGGKGKEKETDAGTAKTFAATKDITAMPADQSTPPISTGPVIRGSKGDWTAVWSAEFVLSIASERS